MIQIPNMPKMPLVRISFRMNIMNAWQFWKPFILRRFRNSGCHCPKDPANLDHTYFTLAPLWCLPISENKVDLHSLWNYPWNGHRPQYRLCPPLSTRQLGSVVFCWEWGTGIHVFQYFTGGYIHHLTCPRPTTFRPQRASHGRLGTWISEVSVPKNRLPASNPEMKICQNFAPCYRARRKPSPVVPVPHGPSLVLCQPYVHQSSGRSLSALPHSSCPHPSMAEVCGLAQLSH